MIYNSYQIQVLRENDRKVLFERICESSKDIHFPFESICSALDYLYKDIKHIISISKSNY